MIKRESELEFSREELMRAIQLYFERLYDTRIVLRGKTSGAYYINIPSEIVRKYDLLNKSFKITREKNEIIIEESIEGLSIKNYGGKKGVAYYLLLPKEIIGKITPGIRVKLFIESEKPLRFRVILPRHH